MKASRIISGVCAAVLSLTAMSAVSASAFEYPRFNPIGYVDNTAIIEVQRAVDINECIYKLSAEELVYNGKAKKPSIALRYGNHLLKKGKDYSVTYSNNVNTGKATITITGLADKFGKDENSYISRFYGTATVNFYIVPKRVKMKVKNYKYEDHALVYWQSDAQADGYEIQISTDKNMEKYIRRCDIKGGNVDSAALYYLNPKKDYYVRIRAYVETTDDKGKVVKKYGNWSDKTRHRRKGKFCYCYKCCK